MARDQAGGAHRAELLDSQMSGRLTVGAQCTHVAPLIDRENQQASSGAPRPPSEVLTFSKPWPAPPCPHLVNGPVTHHSQVQVSLFALRKEKKKVVNGVWFRVGSLCNATAVTGKEAWHPAPHVRDR